MPKTILFAALVCWLFLSGLLAGTKTTPSQFLFGASVYPELLTRDEWNRMLDHFQRAEMNVVRVGESSWGNLEIAPGQFDFAWLHQFLDDVGRRNMKAILGTSTYIAPQWLSAKNPEILVQIRPGWKVHPMARKAACLNHPLYREACRRYISTIGEEFKDHPAVIGWQLDNEIEFMVERVCYNPACERAWTEWLKKTYRTPEEFNRRLDLRSWGMKINALEDVPQPTEAIEGTRGLPALFLANLHFRRNVILDFLIEQQQLLRQAGIKQWITTDWNTVWTALADDSLSLQALDFAGLNFYQPSLDNHGFWKNLGWHQDMHRSAHGVGHFLVTETRVGVAGGTWMLDPFPTREQFHMWMLQPAAFGASGLLYWSGNRWHGGHWPHWGGLLDWTGEPEADFDWVVEVGKFFKKWGERLLHNPVRARAAVITDFDQRAALKIYPHICSGWDCSQEAPSLSVLPESFEALHRLGIGVDAINTEKAEDVANLKEYSLVIIAAATALDGSSIVASLGKFVAEGGHLLVSPFTAYQNWDGVFRDDGFGANLLELTGAAVRTVRRMGAQADGSGRGSQKVRWSGVEMKEPSVVGMDGYCEFLEVEDGVGILGTFVSPQSILDGRPAVTRKKIGEGSVIKLGFWPKDDTLLHLLRQLVRGHQTRLAEPLLREVQAVPRTDGTLFIVNTSSQSVTIRLAEASFDRISGETFNGLVEMRPYQVLWLE